VQIALVVTADERAVLRERHVALDDARALARARGVRLFRVLGELQRRAAMRDRELRAAHEVAGAGGELALERAVVHAVDEKGRAVADLDGSVAAVAAARVVARDRGRSQAGNR
jgi:hypothetical protein